MHFHRLSFSFLFNLHGGYMWWIWQLLLEPPEIHNNSAHPEIHILLAASMPVMALFAGEISCFPCLHYSKWFSFLFVAGSWLSALVLLSMMPQFTLTFADKRSKYSFIHPARDEIGTASSYFPGCCSHERANYPEAPTNSSVQYPQPSLIGIGVQKCGTQFLYSLLRCHPKFKAHKKEIHFFDKNFTTTEAYIQYLSAFGDTTEKDIVNFEITPIYVLVSDVMKSCIVLLK